MPTYIVKHGIIICTHVKYFVKCFCSILIAVMYVMCIFQACYEHTTTGTPQSNPCCNHARKLCRDGTTPVMTYLHNQVGVQAANPPDSNPWDINPPPITSRTGTSRAVTLHAHSNPPDTYPLKFFLLFFTFFLTKNFRG